MNSVDTLAQNYAREHLGDNWLLVLQVAHTLADNPNETLGQWDAKLVTDQIREVCPAAHFARCERLVPAIAAEWSRALAGSDEAGNMAAGDPVGAFRQLLQGDMSAFGDMGNLFAQAGKHADREEQMQAMQAHFEEQAARQEQVRVVALCAAVGKEYAPGDVWRRLSDVANA